MAGIYNVNNAYGVNNRKITSKLAFNVGDKFSGKIIKKDNSGAALIKLSDGWEFPAEVEGDLNSLKEGMAKFEVQGYKDGKLQLKLVSKEPGEGNKPTDDLLQFVEGEGIDKEEVSILKNMLKFNIPLTKENTREVRGIIQFLNKINANSEEIDVFIDKYLQNNNISSDSPEGKLIINELKQFFNNLKALSSEDIMFFLENNLDFDSETIVSYNKFLKGNTNSIVDELKGLNSSINDVKVDNGIINKDEIKTNSDINNLNGKNIDVDENSLNSKDIDVDISDNKIISDKNTLDKNTVNSDTVKLESSNQNNISNGVSASKAYEKQESGGKVDLLSILKTISNNSSNEENTGIIKDVNNTLNSIIPTDKNSDLIKEQIINEIRTFIEDGSEINNLTKTDVEKIISKVLNKEVVLSNDDFKTIKDMLGEESEEKIDLLYKKSHVENIKEVIRDITVEKAITQTLIKEGITQKGEEAKEVLKNIINNIKYQGEGAEKILDILKNSMSDIKLMNKVNNEYYYFNSPVKIMDREYPCKLIVKDNRKDGKKIDSRNVKLIISVKTINLGEIDAFIKVSDKNMFIDLKCEEGFVSTINTIKNNLIDVIQKIGYTTNISVDKKSEPVNIINCRGFFNENNRTNLDIKV